LASIAATSASTAAGTDWLRTQAGQHERTHDVRTFLAVEGLKVVG
jgi:hypothetical protein